MNPLNLPTVIGGGCWQQFNNPAYSSIPYWVNITRVTDYNRDSGNNPISASGIPPYARTPDFDVCNGTNTCGAYSASNNIPLCNIPTASLDWIACPTSSGYYSYDFNCWQLTTQSVDFNHDYSGQHPCKKIGFKNVYARKYWQGRYGYQSDQSLPFLSSSYLGTGILFGNGGTRLNGTPDGTKYRTISYNGVYTFTDAGCSDTYSQTTTVNQYSGIQTLDACSSSGTGSCLASGSAGQNAAQLYLGYADLTLNDVIELFTQTDYATLAATCPTCYTASYDGRTLTLINLFGTDSGSIAQTIYCDFFSTFSTKYYGTTQVSPGIYQYTLTEEVDLNLTNTSLQFRLNAPYSGAFDIVLTASLSNPYTAQECFNDCVGLLGEYNLADDIQYPPREDSLLSMAPAVYYSEMFAPFVTINTGTTHGCEWTQSISLVDGNPANGSIFGVPLPAGFQRFWGYPECNDSYCINPVTEQEIDYCQSYGLYCPAYYNHGMTTSSPTRWTDSIQGGQNFPYSWIRFNDGLLEMQKEVECKIPIQSYNFIRPCGWDRWQVETSSSTCIYAADASGSNPLNVYTFSPPLGINNNDLVYVYDNGSFGGVGGVYVVSSGANTTTLTLNPQFWTSLPTGFDYGSDANNTGFIARMRFPHCPGTCGKVRILSASNVSGSIKITVPDGCSLQTGDTVNLYNIYQSNKPGDVTQNVSITKAIDNNNFTVAGTLGTNFGNGNSYVEAVSSVDSIWNDSTPKGYYLSVQWFNNFRDISQYADPNYQTTNAVRYNQTLNNMPQSVNNISVTQECGPLSAVCKPFYIGFTPNNEFTNYTASNVQAFPSFIPLDGLFGSLWQGQAMQYIQDPLWEAPAIPCSYGYPVGCQWVEDDGNCNTDTCDGSNGLNFYYPHRPIIEAINLDYQNPLSPTLMGVDVPLPAVMIGFYSIPTLNTFTNTVSANNVAIPPNSASVSLGVVNGIPNLWTTINNESQCVCAGGRFATTYAGYGVECQINEYGI